jgi:hypothetical protein
MGLPTSARREACPRVDRDQARAAEQRWIAQYPRDRYWWIFDHDY